MDWLTKRKAPDKKGVQSPMELVVRETTSCQQTPAPYEGGGVGPLNGRWATCQGKEEVRGHSPGPG